MFRRVRFLALATIPALLFPGAACGDDNGVGDDQIGGELILATTTSTQDSGLLDVLELMFEEQTGTDLKVIAVGTGAALGMGAEGEADVVLAHAYEAEQELVESGDLVNGQLLMHNDFVIVGPEFDDAGVASAASLDEAMAAIADDGVFVSRGDNSGTNTKELQLWEAAGIDPASITREETGQGMGATLNIANERQAYTLTDRATYLALRDDLDLVVLFEGAGPLLNIYHVYQVNPEQHDNLNEEQAGAFIDFLVSDEAVEVIETFGVAEYGEPLFVPDVGRDLEDVRGE